MLLTAPRSLYAAFDRFPTRKGAATHIARFAPCLFEHTGGGLLYVMGDATLPAHQLEDGIEILRFSLPVENLLERAAGFGAYLDHVLDDAAASLRIAHFRDPWSGVPILSRPHTYATVFEVNALPSIELPHAYPGIAPRTLEKLRAAETFCLDACDAIVTPSDTTRRLLESLGVPTGKITLVPNGADLPEPCTRPPEAPANYLIYFGALQTWQGVDTLLRAFALLADLDLSLVICGSLRSREARRMERFAERLGLNERTIWRWELSAAQLQPWLAHAQLSLAPLRECARNVSQGCAPLKILESMAAGVPVIASDLPPVRELIRDGVEGRLVAPDRPAELARAIRVLMAYPERRRALGDQARARVAAQFTWERSLHALRGVYENVEKMKSGPVPVGTA
jgi:glycosyltransferase involved in cell wall biosynthesis